MGEGQSNYSLKAFETVLMRVEPASPPLLSSYSKTCFRFDFIILYHHPTVLDLFFENLLSLRICFTIPASPSLKKLINYSIKISMTEFEPYPLI